MMVWKGRLPARRGWDGRPSAAEQLAAVLEHEAQAVGDQARAHAAEVRLDHRDHHAIGVGDGEIGGVAVRLGASPGWTGVRMRSGPDQPGALRGVVLGDQPLDRNLGENCGSA
jgi:hypothetical protein